MNQFKVIESGKEMVNFTMHSIAIIIFILALIGILIPILYLYKSSNSNHEVTAGERLLAFLFMSSLFLALASGMSLFFMFIASGERYVYHFESENTYTVEKLRIVNDEPQFILKNENGQIINESYEAKHGIITIAPGKDIKEGDTVKLISQKLLSKNKPERKSYSADAMVSNSGEDIAIDLTFEKVGNK